MTFKILPSDVYVTEFGCIIRTRCPMEHVTDQMVHQRVVAANLACGDTVRVQCLNHEKDTVLWFAEWLVFDRKSEIRRTEMNDRETRTVEVFSHSIMRTRDWTKTPAVVERTVAWNPGKKVHEVREGDKVVGSSPDKEEAEKMRAGEAPLSVMEPA